MQVILMAHGSRDERWCAHFQRLAQKLQEKCLQITICEAFMELASPKLSCVVDAAYKSSEREFVVWPLFMATGRHVEHDIGQQVEELKRFYPDCRISLWPPLGEHEALIQMMADIIQSSHYS